MPIEALPQDAVRLIGSSQVLTDSSSAVKELIDNALDAHATAIFVSISINALDIIQVKDNGHGIDPGDRKLVGRRYCTSKIRTFADLETIGGRSLGFRGEALASAAEMNDKLHITTRIEGEQVAASLEIGPDGSITKLSIPSGAPTVNADIHFRQGKVSHPVGTTVKITDFLKHVPVRKQQALKHSAKTLAKIRRLLESYALARPSVRFSLTVLKAKNDKGNWSYAPKGEATLADAALKVIGREAAAQCQLLEFPDSKNLSECSFSLQAFLPRADADPSKISNGGGYVSVDARPVTCTKGTLKQILDTYKKHIRSALDVQRLPDPFICLNIVCPPGSYDSNIEPAKDDLLFVEPGKLIEMVEQLFTSIYGVVDVGRNRSTPSTDIAGPKQTGFDLLLARKPQPSVIDGSLPTPKEPPYDGLDDSDVTPVKQSSTNLVAQQLRGSSLEVSVEEVEMPAALSAEAGIASAEEDPGRQEAPKRSRTWRYNMYKEVDEYGLEDEASDHASVTPLSEEDDEAATGDIRVSNPWTIAKMNAPIGHRISSPGKTSPVRAAGVSLQLLTPDRSNYCRDDGYGPSGTEGSSSRAANENSLPSPQKSPLTGAAARSSRDPSEVSTSGSERRAEARRRYGKGALDTWVQRSLGNYNVSVRRDDTEGQPSDLQQGSLPGFSSAREALDDDWAPMPVMQTPLQQKESVVKSKAKRAQVNLKKPFVPPVRDPYDVWFQHGSGNTRKPEKATQVPRDVVAVPSPLAFTRGEVQGNNRDAIAPPGQPVPDLPSLDELMEFEHRKATAARRRRELILQQAEGLALENRIVSADAVIQPNSPHRNRYNAAIAALSPSKPGDGPVLPHDDPRSYLIRANSRRVPEEGDDAQAGHKAKRTKTSRLPLESIPSNSQVHALCKRVKVDCSVIKHLMVNTPDPDICVQEDVDHACFPSVGEDSNLLEERLRAVFQTFWVKAHGQCADIQFDLNSVLKGHSLQTTDQ